MAKEEDRYGIKRARRRRDQEGRSEASRDKLQGRVDARKELRRKAGEEASGAEVAANYNPSAAGDSSFNKKIGVT